MFHVQPLLASQADYRGSAACCVIATVIARTMLLEASDQWDVETLLQSIDHCVALGSKWWLELPELRYYHPREVLSLLPQAFTDIELLADIPTSVKGEAMDGFVKDTRNAVGEWIQRQYTRDTAAIITRDGFTFVLFKCMHQLWCVDTHANSIRCRKNAFLKSGVGHIQEGQTGFLACFPMPSALVDFVVNYCEVAPEQYEDIPIVDSNQVQLVELGTT